MYKNSFGIMLPVFFIFILLFIVFMSCSKPTVTLSREEMLDKIKGGWVGKAYGVSFGGPTEFTHMGKIIEKPLSLNVEGLKGLPWQDDMAVNMGLLK